MSTHGRRRCEIVMAAALVVAGGCGPAGGSPTGAGGGGRGGGAGDMGGAPGSGGGAGEGADAAVDAVGAAGTGGASATDGGAGTGAGGSGGGAGTGAGGGAGTGAGGGAGAGTSRIAIGGQRACALAPNGVARCWGSNLDLASLAFGASSFPVDRAAPIEMTPLLGQHIVDIAVTESDLCVLKDEGSVFCNGGYANQIVTGIGGPATQICVGFDGFGCALRNDGKVFCWGDGSFGRAFGGGFTFAAVEATGVADAVGVACGAGTACALNRDGTAGCWGGGRGTPVPNNLDGVELPLVVPELGSDIASLQAGAGGICALARSGGATCFGPLFGGVNTFPLPAPRAVPELNGARAVAIGDRHVCAAGADGAVRCWGANDFGQLADGTFTAHTAPAPATALGGGGAITQIAAGAAVTCARFTSGGVRCVGSNDHGALGDGSALSVGGVPITIAGAATVAAYEAAIDTTGSAVLSDGSVVTWGGIPSVLAPASGPALRAAAPVPVAAPPAQPAAVQAFVTDASACLRAADGGVRCLKTTAPTSFDVVRGFESGSVDLDNNCAAPAGGGVRCGIGIANVTPFAPPGSVRTGPVVDLAVGFAGACVLRPDGTVECWTGTFLGTSSAFVTEALPVTELGGPIVSVAVGDDGCGVRNDGAVLCWGLNANYPFSAVRVQLPTTAAGITAASGIVCPHAPSGGRVCVADASHGHACAVTTAGELYCWGDNTYGQLGDGTTTARTGVVRATAPGGAVLSASAGNRQTCALRTADRRLICWGWNGAGELGSGTGGPRATATAVSLP